MVLAVILRDSDVINGGLESYTIRQTSDRGIQKYLQSIWRGFLSLLYHQTLQSRFLSSSNFKLKRYLQELMLIESKLRRVSQKTYAIIVSYLFLQEKIVYLFFADIITYITTALLNSERRW